MQSVNDYNNLNSVTTNGFKSLVESCNDNEDEIQHNTATEDVEIFNTSTSSVDSTESDRSLKNQSTSHNVHSEEDYEKLDIQKALSHMTINDLNQFLNVYQMITSPDPNVDKTIIKASMDQLLSGELLDGEHFNNVFVSYEETSEFDEKRIIDDSSVEQTFFDVYDHIESWRKRIEPIINIIDDVSQEYKMIIQQASNGDNMSNVSDKTPSISLKQSYKSDNVTNSSSRYLSNIDKYIETSKIQGFLSDILNKPQEDIDIKKSDISLNSNKCDSPKPDDIEDSTNKVISSITDEEIHHQSLLIPSTAYKEIEDNTNNDELEVKTYFIELNNLI